MSKDLKVRLLLVAGIIGLLLVLSCFFGVNRAIEIVHAVLTGKPIETRPDDDRQPPDGTTPAGPGEYLLCFWNVENLFDDSDDGRKGQGDPQYDGWFGRDREALDKKLEHLCNVLIPLNGGRGPDILGACEVESERAAQLLADAMNKRLKEADHYTNVLQRGNPAGRHISPVLITRLPVVRDRTRADPKRRRILRTVLRVGKEELIVVVSHWTSRVSDKTGDARARYADVIHGEFRAAHESNPKVDYLICGDFNDNPDDPSVADNLRATGDLARVKESGETPLLFDPFAKLYADGGATHVYGKKKYVFDHICVSSGMLDESGWSCDVDSARIVTSFADRQGRPNRFGGENDKRPFSARGASDHFPVTVRLRVR
jgi:endonuclease/exonuclease/phosphatase family metal-dependent hydrolase